MAMPIEGCDTDTVTNLIVEALTPICPSCRLTILGAVSAAMMVQICPEQRNDYLKDLVRLIMEDVVELATMEEGTVH